MLVSHPSSLRLVPLLGTGLTGRKWAVEGPGEGWTRWELGRAPTRPSPEDAQAQLLSQCLLSLERLPGL